MKYCIVVLFAALSATSASAQTLTPSDARPAPEAHHGLKTSMLIWAAAVAADQITTYRFTSHDRDLLHEENVLLRGLDRSPVALVAAGSAMDAAMGWACYKFIGSKHPKLARALFYGAAAYRGYLAGSNVQMMREAAAIRAAADYRSTR